MSYTRHLTIPATTRGLPIQVPLGVSSDAHGPDRFNAGTINTLGVLRFTKGSYVEGRALMERSLQSREKFLGSDHPDRVLDLNNLAVVLAQARFAC